MVLDFKNNKIWAKFYGFYTFYEYLRAVERLTKGCMCKNDILGGCKYNFRQFAEQKSKKYWKMTISSIFQKPPPASIGPFDNLILCTQAMEWGFWRKRHFGRSWAHLGVKTSKKVDFWGKNGHFDHFPEATTGFNLGLLTFRFHMHGPWNWDFEGKDISGGLGHI